MSEDSIPILITVGIVALVFASVSFLNAFCPRGWRSAEKAFTEKKQAASVSTLSSQRLADQSRDFLRALSAREERGIPRSQAGRLRVPPSSAGEFRYPKGE
jgi:hypothetical protein